MNLNENETTSEVEKNQPPIPLEFAPVWKRILAYVIDLLVIGIILEIIITISFPDLQKYTGSVNNTEELSKFILSFMGVHAFHIQAALFVLEIAYFSLGWASRGQTLGAFILKIAVISINKKRLTLVQSLFRSALLYLAGQLLYVILIFVFNPVYRQRFHDFLTGSVVVNLPKVNVDDSSKDDTTTHV